MSLTQYIHDLIVSTLAEGSTDAELVPLLWTVDAREHCIPTPQEINDALKKIENYSIVRDENGIRIVNDEGKRGDLITATDIKKAMVSYRKQFGM